MPFVHDPRGMTGVGLGLGIVASVALAVWALKIGEHTGWMWRETGASRLRT